jgi:hypothetical protein
MVGYHVLEDLASSIFRVKRMALGKLGLDMEYKRG